TARVHGDHQQIVDRLHIRATNVGAPPGRHFRHCTPTIWSTNSVAGNRRPSLVSCRRKGRSRRSSPAPRNGWDQECCNRLSCPVDVASGPGRCCCASVVSFAEFSTTTSLICTTGATSVKFWMSPEISLAYGLNAD